jgi:hypothetical protein
MFNSKNEEYEVTNADKKGNTPAYQAYKAGKKDKTGKPMYRAADHMKKEEVQDEEFKALTPDKKDRIRNQAERRGKDANREQSAGNYPTSTRKDQEVRKMKSVLNNEVDLDFVNSLIESGKFSDEEIEKIVEAQVARNDPEKYERDQEKKDTRSKKQKRMDDPEKGINSPAFKKFMQQQGA